MIAFMAQVARYSCATRRPYAAPAARVTKQAAHVIAAVQEQASSTRMTSDTVPGTPGRIVPGTMAMNGGRRRVPLPRPSRRRTGR